MFCRLQKPLSESTLDNIVKQLLTGCSKPDCDGQSFQHLLVQNLYMEVRDDKNWEDVTEVSTYAPLMTDKQSKILALLCKLHETGITLRKGQNREIDLVGDFVCFIRYSLFGKDGSGLPRMQSFKIGQLANLTRMFMALTRYSGKFFHGNIR